jgi:hypothetical protein
MCSAVIAALLCSVGLPSAAQSDHGAQGRSAKPAADIAELQQLTKWSRSDAGSDSDPNFTCGVGANPSFERVRLDHEVNGDNATVNRAISDLDRQVVAYLKKHGWSVKAMGIHSGIPDMERCYQKDGFVVQVFKTTGRCTMNSPCTVYDGFSVITYAPVMK